MGTKTERITILGSREFKTFLTEEAAKEGISLSELVRRRCEQRPPSADDEQLLVGLVAELDTSIAVAQRSLDRGIQDAEAVLAELRAARDPDTATKQAADG